MENTSNLRSGPKDIFLHLFNIVTFYLLVVGFITLFIQYINALFPDALNYYFNSISDSVRVASSILFISVPAYLLSSWLLSKDLKEVPAKRDLGLRKGLLYFTLFVSAITIIVDLIVFIYNFLSGELTVQFFLKIFSVLMIAAAVFGYYIWDLKRTDLNSQLPKILATVLSVITLVSIVAGFFIVGTPATQRSRRFDEQRIADLQSIQNQITYHWAQKGSLPANLAALSDSISGFVAPSDPETKVQYEYRVTGTTTFELCADFKTVGPASNLNSPRTLVYTPNDPYSQSWAHEARRTCFGRTIDPELYKAQSSVVPVKY